MATRHLKRLQQQKEAELLKTKQEHEDDSDVDESPVASKPPFNPFDLLSDEEEGAQGDEEQEVSEPEDEKEAEHIPPPPKVTPAKQANTKKKKSKKKNSKQPTKNAEPADSDDEPPATSKHALKDADVDIDALVKELNLTTAGPAPAASNSSKAQASESHLLAVDVRSLRGDEELRRIFGSDVIQEVDRQEMAEAAGRRRHAAAMRGMPGRRRTLKKGLLITPKDHWPPYDGGLTMQPAGVKDGRQVFRYVFTPSYRHAQHLFEQCQATYDPNNIAALLQQHPYHVDALLAMYDLYRHMGDNQYAEEVLARALYALEMSWHPHFNIATANCCLDFAVEENRPMFTALFRHIQALSRQGCHRTALECCKLLLALDTEDPCGALQMVDYLSLRAARYDFLHRFVAGYEGNRALALLPNYAYALALARLRMEQQESAASNSSSKADLPASAQQPSSQLLTQACLLHPLVVPKLLSKLQDKGVGREACWQQLMQRKLFAKASDGGSPGLAHLVGIYVERSHLLWKAPDALEFLHQGAAHAADIAEGKASSADGIGAEDWAAVRAESFPSVAGNEYRHLRLHDFSDHVNALPREEVQAAMQAGGPAGLEDALAEIQEQMALAQEQAAANGGAPRAMTDEEVRNANPLMMLLRSMMPWVNAGQQPNYDSDGAEEVPNPENQ